METKIYTRAFVATCLQSAQRVFINFYYLPFFFFFEREFQPIASALDDNSIIRPRDQSVFDIGEE